MLPAFIIEEIKRREREEARRREHPRVDVPLESPRPRPTDPPERRPPARQDDDDPVVVDLA
jgi:hypothetical protein